MDPSRSFPDTALEHPCFHCYVIMSRLGVGVWMMELRVLILICCMIHRLAYLAVQLPYPKPLFSLHHWQAMIEPS